MRHQSTGCVVGHVGMVCLYVMLPLLNLKYAFNKLLLKYAK